MGALANIIDVEQYEILRRWALRARAAAAARGLDKPALENILPEYLKGLAASGDELGYFTGQRRRHIEVHAGSRIRQGYALPAILEELALLGRCIAESWEQRPRAQWPTHEEIEALFSELHFASLALAEMFTHRMLDDEQVEKRYLRQLQTIVTDALQAGAQPLEARLDEIVDLLREAMDAQCAALLIIDRPTQKLKTGAAVGAGSDVLARSLTNRALVAFRDAVAEGESAVTLGEGGGNDGNGGTRRGGGAVPPELRHVGIRALIGLRLPLRLTLVGQVYVGCSSEHAFSQREARRLESLGQHLSLHLDNARLQRQLRERLDALDLEHRLRDRFVSVLAHDMRGPLSAARISAHLLTKRPDRLDTRRELAERIDRNIERVDHMIRDLLDANRLRAGQRLPLRIDRCDLAALAAEVAVEMTATFGPRFSVESDADVSGFWSHDELRRALWNLTTNAIKYGAADAQIKIEARHSGEGDVRLSVHNWGTPIPPEDHARLFRPFARARGADAGPQEGWGLGLTLVGGCAEAHGGHVEVHSEAEAGTTFTIVLPRDARAFQGDDAAAARPAAAAWDAEWWETQRATDPH